MENKIILNPTELTGIMGKQEMEKLREELNELREEVAELRLLHAAKPTRVQKKDPCQGLTGKGTPCRNGALPGTCYRRVHSS